MKVMMLKTYWCR